MEQKHPADIYTEVLDHLWTRPGGKGLEASEKGRFQKENQKWPDLPDLV